MDRKTLRIVTSVTCICLSTVGIVGCGSSVAATGTVQTPKVPKVSDCQVRLEIQSTNLPGVFQAIDRTDGEPGVCLKRPGRSVTIPPGIELKLANGEDVDTTRRWYGYKRNAAPICVETNLPDSQSFCTWNGRIRDKFGIEFKLVDKTGSALVSTVQAVQLYVNGELRFSRALVSGDGSLLTIPYSAIIDAGLTPFDAKVDLHLVPASAALEPALLTRQPSPSDRYQWAINAAEALAVTARASFPKEAGMVDCLTKNAAIIKAALGGLRDGTYDFPAPSPNCKLLATPNELAELGAYFDKLESGIATGSETAKKAEDILGKLADWLRSGEAVEVKAVLASLPAMAKSGAEVDRQVDNLQSALSELSSCRQAVHALIESSQQGIVLAAMTARNAQRNVKNFVKDSSAQNAAFNKLVAQLEAKGGPFQDHHANPAAPAGAATLQMTFADVFQFYGFAPWHAVPVRVTGRNQGSEVSVANAIPILDVFGLRWQWADSRMADFRLAMGGFYIPDVYTKTSSDGTETTQDVFNPGLQLNASLANLHVGAGYVFGRMVEGRTTRFGWNHERVRLMVGLDLYKLITGGNVEVF